MSTIQTRFRGQQKSPTKRQVTVRLDADLLDALKKGGGGWQTRLNDTLRAVLLPETLHPGTGRVTIKRVIVDPTD